MGVFVFIFGKDKLSFYISTALWLRKYDGFFIFFCASLGEAPSFWFSTLPVLGAIDLVNVEIKRFDLTRDHVIEVSRDCMGGVP